MNLMHTREWISFEEMNLLLCDKKDKEIKSWLLEEGPITKRIKSNGDFELELIKDKVDFVRDDEKSFLEEQNQQIIYTVTQKTFFSINEASSTIKKYFQIQKQ